MNQAQGSREASKALAVAFVEQIGLLNSADMVSLLAESFVFRPMFRATGLPLAPSLSRAAFCDFIDGAVGFFPNRCPHRVLNVIADGDQVAVESECHTTLSNGAVYNNVYSFHFTITDGAIVEVREYTDFLLAHQVVFQV